MATTARKRKAGCYEGHNYAPCACGIDLALVGNARGGIDPGALEDITTLPIEARTEQIVIHHGSIAGDDKLARSAEATLQWVQCTALVQRREPTGIPTGRSKACKGERRCIRHVVMLFETGAVFRRFANVTSARVEDSFAVLGRTMTLPFPVEL